MATYAEKKTASEQYLAAVASGAVDETTPPSATGAVKTFAAQLSAESVVRVPVIRDVHGLFGWCSGGVQEKIKNDGGAILFGWIIWEWPRVMLTAEFHAVWVDPGGALVDITPKPHGETSIIFVPDRSYPQNFDFDRRPGNRRVRTYLTPDCSHEVAARVQGMKPSQRDYELRRAPKVGKSLEEWIAARQPVDPLPMLINMFLDACGEHEAKMETAPKVGTGHVVADKTLQQLAVRKMSLLRQIRTAIQQVSQ